MKKTVILIFLCLAMAGNGFAKQYEVTSPDQQLVMKIQTGEHTGFDLYYDGTFIGRASQIMLNIAGMPAAGEKVTVRRVLKDEHNEIVTPVVPVKNREIEDHYRELVLQCKGDYQMVFRVYNDGIAYRFHLSIPDSIEINDEHVQMRFPDGSHAFYPAEESFFSHSEREYMPLDVADIRPGNLASLPALFRTPRGINILLTESDLLDYPGMWLEGSGAPGVRATFPRYPKTLKQTRDRDVEPVEREDFLARTAGTRDFPWRVWIVAPQDKDLLASELVYKLATPQQLTETGWIKPGKVAWDWWNALNVYGVDFHSGVNTDTYKYFIDFAAGHGIDYIIMDEGWYELGDLMKINPDIDMEALVRYAREKKVGIVLWVVWKTLYDQMDEALNQFEAWGIKGIKVDFMQRDDQWMVNFYRKVAEEAAKRHLLVDFHGAFKPSGLRKMYPNVITREGVRGLEWCKWSDAITPTHDVTIPFIRMVAGPMDFTPGAMHNAQKINFHASYSRPMSQGTRVHQLAMYVVYESPLQMLADNPSNYLREPECLSFLSEVPVTWDRTVPLDASVGEYVAVARQKNDTWYVGAMNNENARELSIDLRFLPEGEYTLQYYKDGINADRYAEDFATGTMDIQSGDHITLQLASGGGWVGIIRKR